MENDILGLLDELEEVVDRGTKIPMTGKVLVDDTVMFEILDRIRSVLPEELRNAKWVLTERQRILDEAETEARKIVEQGKSYVEKIAGEDEIAKQAKQYAEEIVKKAQAFAREVKNGAIQYADDLLQHAEEKIYETVQAVHHNREELNAMLKQEERGKQPRQQDE